MTGSDLNPQSPWPGLLPYNEADRKFFFGRNDEAEQLLRVVRRNVLTVVFGPSGTGKTSLIQAGLFPRLRAEGFTPQRLRLDHALDLVEQARAAVGCEVKSTLWECFHRLTDAAARTVIVIDQFEEIFTLGDGRPESAEFLEQLADLVENYYPAAVRERLEKGESLDFDIDSQDYRIVLALREEYVSRLDNLRRRMPAVMRSRLVLEPFTDKQALEAVQGPGSEVLEPGVAQQIVDVAASKGRGQRVIDPALLSLICRELVKRRNGKPISPRQLTGYSEAILSDFWENSVSGLPEASREPVREFVEDFLMTPDGFRTAAPMNRLAGHQDAIKKLIEGRVLRNEERFGTTHVELTHDVLCPVVGKSREDRLRRQAEAKVAEQRQQERRRLWWAGAIALVLLVSTGVSVIMGIRATRALNAAVASESKAREAQQLLAGALIQVQNAEEARQAVEDAANKFIDMARSRNAAALSRPNALAAVSPVIQASQQPTCQALLKSGFRGPARPLVEQDIHDVAAQMRVEPAVLWAYLRVEAVGTGFLNDGRPDILFERHIFHRLTGGKFDRDSDISNPQPGGYGPPGVNQYTRMEKAAALDCVSALSATSWGLTQILGTDYAITGFPDVASYVQAQTISEGNQLQAFGKWAEANGLLPALQAKDWTGFARKYDGEHYATARYDIKLRAAYNDTVAGHVPDLKIRAAQFQLARLGLYAGAVEGFGSTRTTAAIVAFQQRNKIPPDGVIGGRTAELLFGGK